MLFTVWIVGVKGSVLFTPQEWGLRMGGNVHVDTNGHRYAGQEGGNGTSFGGNITGN